MSKLWVCTASVLITAAGLTPAMAQTGEGFQLEEVVVTAERREMNLQKVSTSIQVRDGQDLRQQGKKRIDEIMQGTIGIQAQDSQVGVTFFIRGVDAGGASTPILIDGVAQSRSESVRGGTLDLARAEVMRGPQSTNLGANALTGAISLVSNQPVFKYEGTGTLEVGNYDKRSVEGVLNVPLADNQALRVAYSSDKRDGFSRSGGGETDLTNARVRYRWQPSDKLNIVAGFANQKIGGNGVQARQLLAYGTWVPFDTSKIATYASNGTGPQNYNVTFTGCIPGATVPGTQVKGLLTTGEGAASLGCPTAYLGVNDGSTFRTRADAYDDGLPPNAWTNEPFRDTDITQGSVEVDWDTAYGTVTFLPSYQNAHFVSLEPFVAAAMGPMAEDVKQRTSTADLRMNSKTGGKLTWQAGLYYSQNTGPSSFASIYAYGSTGMNGIGVCPVIAGSVVNCWGYDLTEINNRANKSAYGNFEFSLMDTVRLIGGIRYNSDSQRLRLLNGVDGNALGPYAVSTPASGATPARFGLNTATVLTDTSATWKKSTYRAGLEWDVTPNTMVYGVYSTGYTPGAISTMNGAVSSPVTLEQSTVGWKSQFLDNRMQLNGEAFETTFHNRNINGRVAAYVGNANPTNCGAPNGATPVSIGVTTDTSGAGFCLVTITPQVPEFVSKGIDIDLTWLLSANDRLTLSGEYLHSVYDSRPQVLVNGAYVAITDAYVNSAAVLGSAANPGMGVTAVPNAAQVTALVSGVNSTLDAFIGSPLQNAPKYSATLDYQHTFVFAGGSRLTPRLSGTYKQRYWSYGTGGAGAVALQQILADYRNPNQPAWQQAYTKWDFLTSWDSADGRVNLTAYIRNLNEKLVMIAYQDPYISLESPRTFGATINVKF